MYVARWPICSSDNWGRWSNDTTGRAAMKVTVRFARSGASFLRILGKNPSLLFPSFSTWLLLCTLYIILHSILQREEKTRRPPALTHFRCDPRAEASTPKSKVIQQLAWRKYDCDTRRARPLFRCSLTLRYRNNKLMNSLMFFFT